MDIIENQKKVQWEAETPVLIIDQADQSNEEKAVATNNEKDTMSNPEDAKALADIEKYGCHILRVMEEGDEPPFSYTIGMRKSSHHPDLIVVGLSQELSHSILNEYSRRVKAGEKFIDGDTVSGFLEGFDCQLKKVNKKHHKNYLGWALWLYKKEDFEYLQLVYPNTQGVWPWDPKAKPAFVQIQPLLQ